VMTQYSLQDLEQVGLEPFSPPAQSKGKEMKRLHSDPQSFIPLLLAS
jgi:hypothetical protein